MTRWRRRKRIETSLRTAETKGKIASAREVLDRIRFTTAVSDMEGRHRVVEAIVASERAKTELSAELDRVVEAPDAVLASNTSSIPIMQLATAPAVRRRWWARTSSAG